MENLITHKEYVEACLVVEELIDVVDETMDDSNVLVQKFLNASDIVEAYEIINTPIGLPSLKEVIELRMFEMKLKQKDLAILLGVNTARVSEYLSGKREITLDVAKSLHKKLNIDSEIILQ